MTVYFKIPREYITFGKKSTTINMIIILIITIIATKEVANQRKSILINSFSSYKH